MSKLKLNITMSIDGLVAGPDQSPEHPLGVGGEELHDWLVPLKAFRESHGRKAARSTRARRSPRTSSPVRRRCARG